MFADTVGVNQTHDFNPGIHPFPSGLFWTIPISSGLTEIDLENGTATFRGDDQPVHDFGSLKNSLANGAGDPAVVSYTVRWHTILDKDQVENEQFHVEGLFLQTKASIEWSGTNLTTGKTFTAEQDDQKVIAAQLAHERNGVFFD